MAEAGGARKFRSAVKAAYEPFPGSVTAVDCAPFARNLLAAAGSDGSLRLYNAATQRMLLRLEPSAKALHCCQWSPVRPLVLAAGTADGQLVLYDLARGALQPLCSAVAAAPAMEPPEGDRAAPAAAGTAAAAALAVTAGVVAAQRAPLYTLAFNEASPEYLATGCGRTVQVWELGPRLCCKQPGELRRMEALAEAEDSLAVQRDVHLLRMR